MEYLQSFVYHRIQLRIIARLRASDLRIRAEIYWFQIRPHRNRKSECGSVKNNILRRLIFIEKN